MTDPNFFPPSRRMTVGEVAEITGARLLDQADADRIIARLSSLNESGPDALVYVESKQHVAALGQISATALLCPPSCIGLTPPGIALLVTDRPHKAYVVVARLMFPDAAQPTPTAGGRGISPAAHVAPDAQLEDDVTIEPGAVVGARAVIGRGTVIGPNAVVGHDCRIGRNCHVGAGTSVEHALVGDRVLMGPGVRIGHDGFGFLPGARLPEKVPQLGRVVIQDDVEIGANSTVDRGAIDDTIVGEGTKIDNLVQIAHNVRIGRGCLIAGQVGISGSVKLGDGVMLGGGVGIADHVSVGAGAAVAASAGVMHDIPAGQKWGGTPAQPLADTMREFAILRRLVRDSRKRKADG